MAFADLYNEATGLVPKLPLDYARTLVNRAWRDVRRKNLWSFLLFDANWTSPGIVNGGTVSTTQGVNTIVFDATASAQILAIGASPSLVTQRQFRIGVGTIYNIWGLDSTNPSAVVLTLDRNYQEPTASGQAYMIYQCYYAAPMKDFWQWLSVRDMVNYNDLITTRSREWIDLQDPQRIYYLYPSHVVPYQVDMNPNSSTFGWQMFELWGQPQYELTYQLWGVRKGTDLVLPTDTLPPQVGEDVVMALTKKYAFEWAEANKVDSRMMGSDFRFLIGEAQADYKRLFAEYRLQDRATVDNYRATLRRNWTWPRLEGWYNSIAAVSGPGT